MRTARLHLHVLTRRPAKYDLTSLPTLDGTGKKKKKKKKKKLVRGEKNVGPLSVIYGYPENLGLVQTNTILVKGYPCMV